jgi:hypothetical protein
LAALPDADLRVYFAWTPMLETDSEQAAELAAGPIADPRAAHYWDPRRHLARALGEALGISASESIPMAGGFGAAWDVYLAYRRGEADIRSARFWMHQIGVTHAPRLDAEEFIEGVRGLL